ncbi:uncharacterized protein FOMMEDRAFT_138064 [Fomitiporia mediterranea MF3/22]|uniref:uncharacterized protein n=1 Tax=Fomitiporia mediterranea (strain MF3/22) TaxID=694068 RepID=UPI0004408DEB|nr:uncharacterized protein FOMMEDRAFT_138064 [Fomitiporia mediterranea MF3/22]EJD08009.1 hypothetical protein FOMMEDRAFT_138064 [Fomitiporia mediterranea MF3/22]
MNSYPAELLVQLAPVMFVSGLDSLKQQVSSTSSSDEAPTTPATPATPMPKSANFSDQFAALINRLQDVLSVQRKPAIWVPEQVRKGKTFQVVFVDKTVQFPPRKIPDPTSSLPPHSPLSPLHPSSPLHPDGLIAPIWIRKHTSLVPSVFVLFLRLFENPTPVTVPRSPLEPDGPDVVKDKEEREKEDRQRDTELAREIADRKKTTNERGMKLTVVLLASRRMLDDPTLDGRLTFIRRTSGLDSRAALFVLSPVSPSELADFVKSIQQALFDPAIEYYTSHAKRVRRKRNRHAQASVPAHGLAPAARALPLRPEGWTVRYEYKMACFAEFRGEEEVALKHYQDSYSTLEGMFTSPSILLPRTKRWAEAKVLADSMNIKICKLFLYNAEHALALSQLNSHMRRFCDLSARVWGIDEDTYEFWSWVARQYRIFAELLEQGTQFGLTVPTHVPSATTNASTTTAQPQLELEALRALGLNPNTALMHPGFYYYFAAECTERRRLRFLQALEGELAQGSVSQAPGFQNEKKVDHLGSILELYTKAYELFKKYSALLTTLQNQMSGRFTLSIAYRIAQTYYESGKYDMSVRFFERIARTYSREKWGALLQPLLATWYACAQQLGDVEMSIRLLIEMVARGAYTEDDEGTPAEDLHAVLKSTVPSPDEALVVDLTDNEPLFDCSVIFWAPEIKLDERVAFQINLSVPQNVILSEVPIDAVKIFLSDGRTSITLRHLASESDVDASQDKRGEEKITRVDIGHLALPNVEGKEADANLTWRSGSTIFIVGTFSSEIPQELKFTRVTAFISEGKWNIEVPFSVTRRRDVPLVSPKWLSSRVSQPPQYVAIRRANVSSVIVKHRPHRVDVAISHRDPAYLDEPYPISIDVTNNDDKELEFSLDVLLQPGDDDSVNHIAAEEEQSSGLIKGISFGKLHPGTTACKTLHLMSSGVAGERMIDVSVQSQTISPLSNVDPGAPEPRMETSEVLQTIVVPTVAPFVVAHQTTYARRTSAGPGPASLSAFDPDHWDDSLGGRATVTTIFECVECIGASCVLIDSMKLRTEENSHSKLIHCSLDDQDFPSELLPGDQYSVTCELSIAPPDDIFADPETTLDKIGEYSFIWRRLSNIGKPGLPASTRLSLPPLKPPSDGLVALLNAPPLVHLHQPFLLELIIRNHHPTRSACPILSLELEPSESFVAAGIRNGKLPTLIPGAEEKIIWQLIPLECGPAVPLPKIKVTDRRRTVEVPESGAERPPQQELPSAGDEIRIVDVKWDRRISDGSYIPTDGTEQPADGLGVTRAQNSSDKRFTIIVSPA